MTPFVTMAICTRDRAAQLERMLTSACDLDIPAGLEWEVIVVDNGSSDGTADIVRNFHKQLPLRLVEAPVPGIAAARNRAIDEARGRYICWTDDDVILDRRWLSAYLDAFSLYPDAAFFGGRIEAQLEMPASPLTVRCKDHWPLTGVFAQRDFGDEPVVLNETRMPWGANMAVRTAEQKRFRFNSELGASPDQQRTGEESEMVYRLLKARAIGWWVPEAKVLHVIPHYRQTIDYLLSYYRTCGETAAYLHHRHPLDNALEWEGPLNFASRGLPSLYARLIANRIRAAGASLAGMPCTRLGYLANSAYYGGVISYRRAQQKG